METFHSKIYKLCSLVFFYAVTLVLPLYFEDAYFNMLEAKAHIYIFSVCILLPFLCAALVMQIKDRSVLETRASLCWTDWAVLLLGGWCLLSCLCSGTVADSFWGTQGWSVGAFTFCSLAIFYLIVSRHLDYRPNLWIPVLVVNAFIFVVGVLHSAGVDVFSLHDGVVPYQLYYYISTVGQVNWYGCYLCLLFPVFALSYLASEDRHSSLIYYGICFLAVLNVVLCASDGVYLGLGFCVFFAAPYVLKQKERIGRAFHLMMGYGASLLIVSTAPCFLEKMLSINEGISARLLDARVAALVILAGAAGTLLTKLCDRFLTERCLRWMTVVVEACLAVVVVAMFFQEAARFNDSWGTNRGLIWRMSMEVYQGLPLGRKLLGVGPDMLRSYYQELSDVFHETVLASHSEPLQYLLTMGGVGLLAWISLWASLFVGYFRHRVWERDLAVLFVPLAAYFAQSFVNSPQTEGIVLFYLMLACYQRVLRTEITA